MISDATPDLKWMTGIAPYRSYHPAMVIKAVCDVFKVPYHAFKIDPDGKTRHLLFMHMRATMVYSMRHFGRDVGYNEIAKRLGYSHGSSAHVAQRAFKELPEDVKMDLLIRVESELQRLERVTCG